jgi:flavin prenyltransferase
MTPYVLAMTGASGAIYGVRLLQQLIFAERYVHLTISDSAKLVCKQELGLDLDAGDVIESLLSFHLPEDGWDEYSRSKWQAPSPSALRSSHVTLHDAKNFMSPIASGSFRTAGMVICPCSGSTLSGIVHAGGRDLIQRAAEVHLKERRQLIVVPRETPLSLFQLENMQRLASAGGVVMPAMPGWYHGVRGMIDLVDFVVARVLDHLHVEHLLMQRWGEGPELASPQGADHS